MMIRIECSTWEELVDTARKILVAEPMAAGPEPHMEDPEPLTTEPVAPPAKEEPVAEEQAYTMTDVRKFLGDLRKAGKKEAVTELISSMGYSKFTDIPEDRYDELMEKARAL